MTLTEWLKSLFCVLLISFVSFAHASLTPSSHIIVAPKCLVTQLGEHYVVLSSHQDMLLLKVNDYDMDELNKVKKIHQPACGGFINVDEEWAQKKISAHPYRFLIDHLNSTKQMKFTAGPYAIKYPNQVKTLITQLNGNMMWTNLMTLTQFYDRYSRSDNGVKAAKWIRAQMETSIKNTGHAGDVTILEIPTGNYKQPSIVAKFGNGDGPAVVIGAHMDTVRPNNGPLPGADDDGSGTITVLEIARTLLSSQMKFKNPIYFIWYAAEEEGLVGSGYVVRYFKQRNINVNGVMQLDMTGYAPTNDKTMVLYTDYTTRELNKFIGQLIKTYVGYNIINWECGYGCSDHVSWYRSGYPASFPFEIGDNPYIHTSRDTMDLLSLNYMTDFAKLGVSFVTELAEPIV